MAIHHVVFSLSRPQTHYTDHDRPVNAVYLSTVGLNCRLLKPQFPVRRAFMAVALTKKTLATYRFLNGHSKMLPCSAHSVHCKMCLTPSPLFIFRITRRKKLIDFNNFWFTESWGNFKSENCKLTRPRLNNVAAHRILCAENSYNRFIFCRVKI